MIDEIKQCKKDISYESEDLMDVKYDKLEEGFEKWGIGQKITWCYEEDIKFWKEERYFGNNVKTRLQKEDFYRYNCPFSGILFTFPEKRFDIYENAIVCCYDWPVQKENPCVWWISLNRLLISPDLYKIYKI